MYAKEIKLTEQERLIINTPHGRISIATIPVTDVFSDDYDYTQIFIDALEDCEHKVIEHETGAMVGMRKERK